jgi:uncharacterized membrane protein YeaQ/YmgE (transglycosylase-associated protein family)
MNMWQAFKSAAIGILSSKKAVMGIVGALTAGAMKLGWNIDSETVMLVVSPIVAAIIGQGAADWGKEAAKS